MADESLEQARELLRPYVERSYGFSGWMPNVATRVLGAGIPWDYMARADALASAAASVIDIDTGGGERFSEIGADLCGRAVATEEWHVNAPVAAARLGALHIPVVRCSAMVLPFAGQAFDLVLNRHGSLEPTEVARVLRPGGTFLTQQMWRLWPELDRFFPRRTDWGDNLHRYQDGLRAAGLALLDGREYAGPLAFASLGELVYNLCVASWEIPDFDPLGADLEPLLQVETEFTTADGLVLTDGRYIIEARKPAP